MLEIRVAARRALAADITEFELVHPIGSPLSPCEAGAHIDVVLPSGLTRQYSLIVDGEEYRRYRIAVLNEPRGRGGSREMTERVQTGDRLLVSEPRNTFPLIADGDASVLVAGGIGITPIISMARALAKANRPYELIYCAKDRHQAAFLDEVETQHAASATVFLSREHGSRRCDFASAFSRYRPGTHLYVCGPDGFRDDVLGTAAARGWPESARHSESFSANDRPRSSQDLAFDVVVRRTGERVTVGPDESIVAALRRIGLQVTTSCEIGICGTCLLRVSAGIPDHRDRFLTVEEQRTGALITPCCSRASTATLELDFEIVD